MSRDRCVLIVADMQLDFLPGGALPVADGARILAPVAALMTSGRFRNIVAMQDWHPPDHVSFASRHPGRKPYEAIELYGREQVLWPDHCVAGSPGSSLHPALPWHHARAILRKGMDADVDAYSAFRTNYNAQGKRTSTGLGGYLRDCGVTDVYVCGLARDYCVRATAEDAAELGFATTVLWNLTEPVTAASDAVVRAALERGGVRISDAA